MRSTRPHGLYTLTSDGGGDSVSALSSFKGGVSSTGVGDVVNSSSLLWISSMTILFPLVTGELLTSSGGGCPLTSDLSSGWGSDFAIIFGGFFGTFFVFGFGLLAEGEFPPALAAAGLAVFLLPLGDFPGGGAPVKGSPPGPSTPLPHIGPPDLDSCSILSLEASNSFSSFWNLSNSSLVGGFWAPLLPPDAGDLWEAVLGPPPVGEGGVRFKVQASYNYSYSGKGIIWWAKALWLEEGTVGVHA